MRIISQGRDIDIPYDTNTIFINPNNCIYAESESVRLILGRYDSNKEAKAVFREIIQSAIVDVSYYMMPSAESLKDIDICDGCKYWDSYSWACGNGDSIHRGDFTNEGCDKYEK